MERLSKAKPFEYYLLQICLIFLGIGALAGGGSLIAAPSGALLKMPLDALQGTPFCNFLVPGMILFFCIGVLPLLTAYGLAARPRWALMNRLNIDRDYYWASTFSWNAGVLLCLWMDFQFLFIGYGHIIQFIYAALGAVIVTLALLPRIRRMYRIQGKPE